VDISGWSLDQGKLFTFPKDTAIAAQGYLSFRAQAPPNFVSIINFHRNRASKKPLKHGGGQIELVNAAGERVDLAKYKDHDPWPTSPDGYSSSLERICPSPSGEIAENWAASPLPADAPRPAGTPGKKNSCSQHFAADDQSVSAVHDEMEPKQRLTSKWRPRIRRRSKSSRFYIAPSPTAWMEGKEISLP
jgi:hypothetical protein